MSTIRRRDRGRWAAAASLADLARLTEAWLTGEVASQPGYHGPVDVDEGLTDGLVALCRAGMVTRGSQAGYVGPGADGACWEQYAAVTGYADEATWLRLRQALDGTRYRALARGVLPPRLARRGVMVTWRDDRPHTGFGDQMSAGQVRRDLDGAGEAAVTAAVDALQVTIWDPEIGTNTLWEHLAHLTAEEA